MPRTTIDECVDVSVLLDSFMIIANQNGDQFRELQESRYSLYQVKFFTDILETPQRERETRLTLVVFPWRTSMHFNIILNY